ncbi:MAG: YdeI/OmpD-associated family protein [Propionibacteriaceae bacterium]|nr:YdeI/OmpD-associated family protein [Propionibacteriaceae bacterium]
MATRLLFATRSGFRTWLEENSQSGVGVWLVFGKAGGPKTLKASEALEEALCFGWIDGQIKSIDSGSYLKYFAPRRPGSQWSEKNRTLVGVLEDRGLMTGQGRAAIAEAKRNGQWDAPKADPVTDDQIATVAALLSGVEPASKNYLAMSPSVKKTYARAYFDAKTDAGRSKRLAWMTERLNQNLKPM